MMLLQNYLREHFFEKWLTMYHLMTNPQVIFLLTINYYKSLYLLVKKWYNSCVVYG